MQAHNLEISADPLSDISAPQVKSLSSRGTFIKWLRRVHGWVGLWGAVTGLLFGVTGILQNHRAILKIRTGAPVVSTIKLPLPDPVPKSPRELAQYLQATLKLDRPASRAVREAANPVTWGDQTVTQPEHWEVRFTAPRYLVDADYWKGENMVNVVRREQGLLATLEGLHRGNGVRLGWVLFADSIAGGLIFLSLTGVLLWTEMNRRKVIGASIFTIALVTAILFAVQSI
jgi:hypothetical protein